jgi:acetylornithine deacetylase/succinyl-diaminopimelate desuccinylase-like protein
MGMECAIWGPGSIEVAHKPNERLDRGELERARGLLDSLVGNALLEAA